jgi:23S rRNA (pseudouridine1915-N3)-methyltransferase
MRIYILALGDRMPDWVTQGCAEYFKRIGSELSVELIEVSPEKRGKGADIPRLMDKEAKRLAAQIPANCIIVALDIQGKSWSSEDLAKKLAQWQLDGRSVCFLIGGPEGMTKEMLEAADMRVSFSAMTFPHPLVRILLAEQLYRAYSILNNHPYHK